MVRAKLEHESLPSLPEFTERQYHEVHVKLKIPAESYDSTFEQLKQLGGQHGFVPSRNPLDRQSDSVTQFVNMRLYSGNQAEADETVARTLQVLQGASLQVVEVKRETVVLDTHRQLDQWWI